MKFIFVSFKIFFLSLQIQQLPQPITNRLIDQHISALKININQGPLLIQQKVGVQLTNIHFGGFFCRKLSPRTLWNKGRISFLVILALFSGWG